MTAFKRSGENSWRELYTAALFETDRTKVMSRIAEAEAEIVKRGRSLFSCPGGSVEERGALDHALHMLHVLKNCVKSGTARNIAA